MTGDDAGKRAAIRRDGHIAENVAAQNGVGRGLGDRNRNVASGRSCKRRQINPHQIAGFFLRGALEQQTGLIGRPAKNTEANAESDDLVYSG